MWPSVMMQIDDWCAKLVDRLKANDVLLHNRKQRESALTGGRK